MFRNIFQYQTGAGRHADRAYGGSVAGPAGALETAPDRSPESLAWGRLLRVLDFRRRYESQGTQRKSVGDQFLAFSGEAVRKFIEGIITHGSTSFHAPRSE